MDVVHPGLDIVDVCQSAPSTAAKKIKKDTNPEKVAPAAEIQAAGVCQDFPTPGLAVTIAPMEWSSAIAAVSMAAKALTPRAGPLRQHAISIAAMLPDEKATPKALHSSTLDLSPRSRVTHQAGSFHELPSEPWGAGCCRGGAGAE